MPFGWPDLLRSIVDGKYFLKQFLGETGGVAVFLADGPESTPADVHLSHADNEIRQSWDDRVSLSAKVSHPNLLREIAAGETRIDGNEYFFLITEHIQERLTDVVSGRTLTTDEARVIVESALTALGYLHQRGYTHGGVTVDSIVAAEDAVKLMIASVRPLPSDEVESRRAVAGDLRELAETTTEILTGKRELGAGAHLASPFREFVRASFGTEDCPSPTAAQLLGVLNGKPLVAPKKVALEPVPEPSRPAPVIPMPTPVAEQQPVTFKPRLATIMLAGLVVLAVAIFAYRAIAGKSAEERPVRTRTTDIPATETPRPTPVPAARPPAAVSKPPAPSRPRYAVIAAAYNDYDAAARRASRLNSQWKAGEVSVFPEKGQGSRYFVVLGMAASQREADRLLAKARAAGMPNDTYVTRLRF